MHLLVRLELREGDLHHHSALATRHVHILCGVDVQRVERGLEVVVRHLDAVQLGGDLDLKVADLLALGLLDLVRSGGHTDGWRGCSSD